MRKEEMSPISIQAPFITAEPLQGICEGQNITQLHSSHNPQTVMLGHADQTALCAISRTLLCRTPAALCLLPSRPSVYEGLS